MATEFLYASSHITGNFPNPGNAVGNTPGTWAGDLNTNANYTSRWAMANPTEPGTLQGTQTVRVVARKGSNSANPSITINVYENGTLVSGLGTMVAITSTTGQTVTKTFDGSLISNRDAVEIEVVQDAQGGNQSTRNSAQISHIELEAALEVPTGEHFERSVQFHGGEGHLATSQETTQAPEDYIAVAWARINWAEDAYEPGWGDGLAVSWARISYPEDGAPPDEAPPIVKGAEATNVTGTSADSATVPVPSETEEGDLLLAYLQFRLDIDYTALAADGWTVLDSRDVDSPSIAVAWKIASDNEPADYTFFQADTSGRLFAGIVCIGNHDAFDQHDIVRYDYGVQTNEFIVPSVTVNGPRLVLNFWGTTGTGEWTPPQGVTVGWSEHSGTSGRQCSLLGYYDFGPGTTDELVATATNTEGSSRGTTLAIQGVASDEPPTGLTRSLGFMAQSATTQMSRATSHSRSAEFHTLNAFFQATRVTRQSRVTEFLAQSADFTTARVTAQNRGVEFLAQNAQTQMSRVTAQSRGTEFHSLSALFTAARATAQSRGTGFHAQGADFEASRVTAQSRTTSHHAGTGNLAMHFTRAVLRTVKFVAQSAQTQMSRVTSQSRTTGHHAGPGFLAMSQERLSQVLQRTVQFLARGAETETTRVTRQARTTDHHAGPGFLAMSQERLTQILNRTVQFVAQGANTTTSRVARSARSLAYRAGTGQLTLRLGQPKIVWLTPVQVQVPDLTTDVQLPGPSDLQLPALGTETEVPALGTETEVPALGTEESVPNLSTYTDVPEMATTIDIGQK